MTWNRRTGPSGEPKRRLSDAQIAELRELGALARTARGSSMPFSHPAMQASRRLDDRIAEHRAANVRYCDLAAALDVTEGAIQARLRKRLDRIALGRR